MILNAPFLPRKHRLQMMVLCGTMLYFFANVQRVAIPGSIFNLLQEELHVSAPYITGLGSAFMYVYAVNQLIVGLLVDRFGGGRVIITGALVFSVGSMLFPFSHSLWVLYLARVLTGFGASFFYLSLIKEAMRVFGRNSNIMISVIIMIGFTGGILANAPFVALAEKIGYRNELILIGIGTILFFLLYLFCGATLNHPPVRKTPIRFSYFAKVLQNGHNRALFTFSGINFGLYYVIQTVIGKKFLEDYCRMGSDSAAWILSVMGMISAVAGFGMLLLSRKIGDRRRIFCQVSGSVCLFVFSTLTLMLCFGIRSPMLGVLFCILSMTASMSSIMIPLLRETNPPDLTVTSISFMNFSFYLAVAFFGNLTGILMNLFSPENLNGVLVYSSRSYLAVFSVLAFFSCIVFFFSMRMKETFGKNILSSRD